jgi:hypothetical protein
MLLLVGFWGKITSHQSRITRRNLRTGNKHYVENYVSMMELRMLVKHDYEFGNMISMCH